ENPRRQQNKIESLDSENIIRVSKSRSKLGSSLKKLKKPRGVVELCRQKKVIEELLPIAFNVAPYSIEADIENQKADITAGQLLTIKPVIVHEANQFSDTNVLRGNNYHDHHPSNRDNESNRVSREEWSDDYYFVENNSASRYLLDKSVVEERTEKKEPCRIDVEMSESSVEKKRLIGEEIGNFEDKKINSGKWEERVERFLGRKVKRVKHSWENKEAFNGKCKTLLEEVSCFRQMIGVPNQQDQRSKMDSSSKLAILRRYYKEETKGIRGARLRTSGHVILQNIEVNFKVWRNFKFSIPNSPDYVAKIDDPYLHQWKTRYKKYFKIAIVIAKELVSGPTLSHSWKNRRKQALMYMSIS
ncbi:9413_t:CDS:2, partial [Gigaspora margarita]